jgi:hypothetical protein
MYGNWAGNGRAIDTARTAAPLSFSAIILPTICTHTPVPTRTPGTRAATVPITRHVVQGFPIVYIFTARVNSPWLHLLVLRWELVHEDC